MLADLVLVDNLADTYTNRVLSMQPAIVDLLAKLCQLPGDRFNVTPAPFKALFGLALDRPCSLPLLRQ